MNEQEYLLYIAQLLVRITLLEGAIDCEKPRISDRINARADSMANVVDAACDEEELALCNAATAKGDDIFDYAHKKEKADVATKTARLTEKFRDQYAAPVFTLKGVRF